MAGQFAGQGFEDLSALANLILLQAMMLGEEYQLIAGTSTNLATPSAPTATVRNAQSNETALNTTIDHVLVAATNYFGTTAVSGSTAVTVGAGQVVDVTISPVAGATQYNIWGLVSATYYLLASCGGTKYTLQGGAAWRRRPSRPPTPVPARVPAWRASSRRSPASPRRPASIRLRHSHGKAGT